MGHAAQAKIETRNLPASAITFVSRTAEQWSIGVWNSHGAGYGGVSLISRAMVLYMDRAISILPAYCTEYHKVPTMIF